MKNIQKHPLFKQLKIVKQVHPMKNINYYHNVYGSNKRYKSYDQIISPVHENNKLTDIPRNDCESFRSIKT